MARISLLALAILVLASTWHAGASAGDDEKIIGVWERVTGKDKDELEETWVIKKTQGKWTVSGTIFNLGVEVGNFKGKDVKFADGTLSFTQDYFKMPKGRQDGTAITASAEGDRIDFTAKPKKGNVEKDNMKRASDASELLGTWTNVIPGFGFKQFWTFEKDKKGDLSIYGTINKGDKEIGSWKAVNVRYFMGRRDVQSKHGKVPAKELGKWIGSRGRCKR